MENSTEITFKLKRRSFGGKVEFKRSFGFQLIRKRKKLLFLYSGFIFTFNFNKAGSLGVGRRRARQMETEYIKITRASDHRSECQPLRSCNPTLVLKSSNRFGLAN